MSPETGEGRNLSDEVIESLRLLLDALEIRLGGSIGSSLCQCQRHPDTGERRAQLMGDIPQQGLFVRDECLDAFGHRVEVPG